MENFKKGFSGNLRQYGMVIALFVLIVFFQIVTKGTLLMPMNVSNLVSQNAYVLILAIGMLFCIITGNVDLSVGSIVALVGAVSGILIVRLGVPFWLGIIICLIIGAIVGAFQGWYIAYMRVPPFIVTLAGMLMYRGLTMTFLQGQTISQYPKGFQFLAQGFVLQSAKIKFPMGGSEISLNIVAILAGIIASIIFIISELNSRKNKLKYDFEVDSPTVLIIKFVIVTAIINFFTIELALYNGIPAVLVIVVALVIVYTFIGNKTIIGRHIYAMGGNEKAAKLSGVKTKKDLFLVYMNMGILAGLAGMIVAGRLNAATPKAGSGFELDAIAACYIGGASASGGIGTIIGAIVGGLVMGVLNNGMSIMGVPVDMQQVVKGAVLLLAVTFDVYSKSKSSAN